MLIVRRTNLFERISQAFTYLLTLWLTLGTGRRALKGVQTLFVERRETRRRCVTVVSMFRIKIPSTVLLFLIVGGASCIFVFYGLYLLIALIALNLACLLFVPIAKRRGWGAEGRLTRHLNRPRMEDESRRAIRRESVRTLQEEG